MVEILKNILFVSLFPFHTEYFTRLGESIKRQYNCNVFHLKLDPSFRLNKLFAKRLILPNDFLPNESELEEIEFYYKAIRKDQRSIKRRIFMNDLFLKFQVHETVEILYSIVNKNSINMICVWNGCRLPLASAIYTAKKMNLKTMFFENGILPHTTTVDSQGVNFSGSLTGMTPEAINSIQLNPVNLAQLRQISLITREKKSLNLKNKLRNYEDKDDLIPDRFVFVPFQVFDDSQIILHSPNIKTMESLIGYVHNAVEDHNERCKDNLSIVVKEHPSDFGRINYKHLKEQYRNKGVFFANNIATEDLIKKSSGVITINSSVGIEALLFHKQVITLGKAFYNIEGIVNHVADPQKLANSIIKINNPINFELVDKFLYYLRYHYLAEGTYREPNESHYKSVGEKIVATFGHDNSKDLGSARTVNC